MKIEVGLNFENKTYKYLLPILRYYGEEFCEKLSSVFKLACGIDDYSISKERFKHKNAIFILINTTYMEQKYKQFHNYIIDHSSYIGHYTTNIYSEYPQTMYILKIPEEFSDTYENFIAGNYSKMFESKKEIDIFYPSNTFENRVCSRDKTLRSSLIKKVNKEFKEEIVEFNSSIKEYELPLKAKDEIFNYKGKKTFV